MTRASIVATLLVACAGSVRAPDGAGRRRAPPPLLDLLPEGADWALLAKPDELWAAPETRRALAGSVGDEDLAAFRERTGVDLTRVHEAVVAGYGDSVVWMARGGLSAEEVHGRLRRRLTSVVRDRPRWLRGLAQGRQVTLRHMGPSLVAYGEGEGTPVDGVSRGSRPDGALGSLSKRLENVPLRLLRSDPPELPPESGAGLLLSRIRSIAFGLEPAQGRLHVRILLVGELPASADENLRTLVESVGSSGLGRAFGADEAARRAGITVTPGGAEIRLAFDPAEVDAGVRTLFVEDLRGLIEST